MSTPAETPVNSQVPPIVEGPGRYVVYEAPDGWMLARAVGICDTCRNCGCGEQADPVSLPDFTADRALIMGWLMKNANSGLLGNLRSMMRR